MMGLYNESYASKQGRRTYGLFVLNPVGKLPGRSAAYELPRWYLVGVLSMHFAACAWTEISTVCLAPALVFERMVQAS